MSRDGLHPLASAATVSTAPAGAPIGLLSSRTGHGQARNPVTAHVGTAFLSAVPARP